MGKYGSEKKIKQSNLLVRHFTRAWLVAPMARRRRRHRLAHDGRNAQLVVYSCGNSSWCTAFSPVSCAYVDGCRGGHPQRLGQQIEMMAAADQKLSNQYRAAKCNK